MPRLAPRLIAALTALLLLAPGGSALAGERSGQIGDPCAPESESGKGSGSYAVVIGIDEYDHLDDLSGAVRDARAMAAEFDSRGFEVKCFLNEQATLRNIKEHLKFTLPPAVGAADRVVVYFAGHGLTEEATTGEQRGYLMPVDGRDGPSVDGIHMDELNWWFKTYKAKQVLYVADACYSGLAAWSSGGAAMTDMVRRVLTAGKSGELVVDYYSPEGASQGEGHGLFTYHLLEGLRGAADTNNDKRISGLELVNYVTPAVEKTARKEFRRSQSPQSRKQGEGEIYFRNPTTSLVTSNEEAAPSSRDDLGVAYYAATVLRWGALHGVVELTATQVSHRKHSYRITSREGSVRTVERVN
ncbi:MAG: caspase family protein, partial [Myxococcota bacterium]|nr:caspase family protein [Myxococcota bacterium]